VKLHPSEKELTSKKPYQAFRLKKRLNIVKETGISLLITMLPVLALVFIWHLIATNGILELPTPGLTLKVLWSLTINGDPLYNRTLPSIVWESLTVVFKGSLAAFAVAIPLGILMGSVTFLRKFLENIIELFRPVPPLAWIPLAYVFFANMDSPTIYVQQFIVFTGAFFPALTNSLHGVKMIDKIYFDAAYTMGATKRQVFLSILLLGAIPSILAGVRIGLGIGWMCVVAAEFVGGKMGIGYYIWASYSIGGRVPEIISGIIAIGIVGSFLNQAILLLEKKVTSWY